MEQINKVLIVSGGKNSPEILQEMFNKSFDKIIVADGGLEIIDEMGIEIDYLVGDFDTVSHNTFSKYEKESVENGGKLVIKRFRAEKDYTDTQIAIELAISLKPKEIVIIGGLGTRMDHSLANIHILYKALIANIKTSIIDNNNKIYMINKETMIKKEKLYGKYISLIPFTNEVLEVTLEGFAYPLNKYTLKIGDSIGISNQLKENIGKIIFSSGILLVMETRD